MAALAQLAPFRAQAAAPRHRHLRPAADRRVPGRARTGRGEQGPAPARPRERLLAGRRRDPRVPVAVLLRPADPGPAATGRAQSRPVRAVPHRPGRRRDRPRHPGRHAGQRRARLQAVHRRGHQGPRRRGDDGDQGPGLHRGAERAAVAVPGHLHPAGRVPPDLRDRGGHRRRDPARDRRAGLRVHPGGQTRLPHPARGRRPDTRPVRRPPGAGACSRRRNRCARSAATGAPWSCR